MIARKLRDGASLCGLKIRGHPFVPGKNRSRGPQLSAHVGDGALTRATDRFGARAEIFHHPVGAPLDRQFFKHLEDDVFRRRPTGETPCQQNPHTVGMENLPGKTRHHIHGVRPAHPTGEHTEPARIGAMGVRAQHHATRIGVFLQDNLMDDTRPGAPKTDPVAGRAAPEKIVDLGVGGARRIEILR